MKRVKVFLVVFWVVLIVSIGSCAEGSLDEATMGEQAKGSFVDIPIARPCYTYTDMATAKLSFSEGKAYCNGSVKPSGSYDTSVTVTLYKQNGAKWNYITSWSGSATGRHTATAGGSIAVSNGTYKVVTSGNVANLEYPSAKIEKTY